MLKNTVIFVFVAQIISIMKTNLNNAENQNL